MVFGLSTFFPLQKLDTNQINGYFRESNKTTLEKSEEENDSAYRIFWFLLNLLHIWDKSALSHQ